MRSIVETICLGWLVLVLPGCQQDGPIGPGTNMVVAKVYGQMILQKDTTVAGDDLDLVIKAQGKEACILVESSLNEDFICNPMPGESNSVSLPDHISQTAGILQLSLFVDGTLSDRKTIVVMAGNPHNRLQGYLGPKTVSVDDDEQAQLIVLPMDQYHNLCENGISVDLMVEGPTSAIDRRQLTNDHGAAYTYFDPIREEGIVRIGAQSGAAAMRKKEVLYTSAFPAEIRLNEIGKSLVSGLQLITRIETAIMVDNYGNRVTDGTHIDFVLSNDSGQQSLYQSTAVGGKAMVLLPNPEEAGRYTLFARVPGVVESNRIGLVFEPGLMDYPVSYNAGNKLLIAGPVVDRLGGLVADGTQMQIYWNHESQEMTRTIGLVNGMAQIETSVLPGFDTGSSCTTIISSIQKILSW